MEAVDEKYEKQLKPFEWRKGQAFGEAFIENVKANIPRGAAVLDVLWLPKDKDTYLVSTCALTVKDVAAAFRSYPESCLVGAIAECPNHELLLIPAEEGDPILLEMLEAAVEVLREKAIAAAAETVEAN